MSTPNSYYLSSGQRRLVAQERAGHVPCTQLVLRMQGIIPGHLLKEILAALVLKHAALRTVYVEEPGVLYPLQVVMDFDAAALPVTIREGGCPTVEMILEEARAKVSRSYPFDAVVVTDTTLTFLLLTLSGYATDLFSLGIITREIGAALAGSFLVAGEDDLSYVEFSQWQEELLQQADNTISAFWQQYPVSQPQHFYFHQRSDLHVSQPAITGMHLPAALSVLLQEMPLANKVATLVTAWMSVLAKQHGGAPVTIAYRPYERGFTELDLLVGLVGNALPLTVAFDANASLADNTRLVAASIADVTTHQYVYTKEPAEHWPVSFGYLADDGSHISIDAVQTHGVVEDLSLLVLNSGASFILQFQYNPNACTPLAIQALYGQVLAVLTALLQPGTMRWNAVSMLLPSDAAMVHTIGLLHAPAFKTVQQALAVITERCGGKTAVTFNENELSYNTLAATSDQLAKALIFHYNILPGDRVGVWMERSEWLIVILTGIIKAGAAYVPVDPHDAPARAAYILADSHCKLLITDASVPTPEGFTIPTVMGTHLLTQNDSNATLPGVKGEDVVYMIYTSGTTGKPKGVPVKHASLLDYISWISRAFAIGENDATALLSSHAFDLGYTSLWGALLNGGTLHIVPEYLLQVPAVIVRYLQHRKVTFLKTTPSFFHLLRQEAGDELHDFLPHLRLLLLGGEKYKVEDLAFVWDVHPGARIVNHYGPTETTIGVLAHEMQPARIAEYREQCIIGNAADNHTVLVLDEALNPCPAGIKGEIYIGGPGLSDGYFQQDEYTATRFIQHTASGLRLYKTGDEGCWNLQGELTFIGRLDKQVKINGYRVELSETEAALRSVTGITDALVTLQEQQDSAVLVAWYVAASALQPASLRALLADKLPVYMIPSVFKQIAAIPLTINGKTDYAALLQIAVAGGDSSAFAAPQDDTERMLLSIWQKVLGKQEISVYDNFFQLGGDSIKAIQISSRLHHQGYQIPVREIFINPDIRSQALALKPLNAVQVMPAFEGSFPATPVYRYFFEHIRLAPHHYNQSMLLAVGNASAESLSEIFDIIFTQHDILRLTFKLEEGAMRPVVQPPGFQCSITHSVLADGATAGDDITKRATALQNEIDLFNGPLVKLHLFETGDNKLLLVILHHTVTDVVSWNILLDDLDHLLQLQVQQQPLVLPYGTASYGLWASWLQEYAASAPLLQQLSYWQQVPQAALPAADLPAGSNRICDVQQQVFSLPAADTVLLVNKNHTDHHTGVLSALLAALGMALQQSLEAAGVSVMLESHGRDVPGGPVQVSRTMGWFTALYPFYLPYAGSNGIHYEGDIAAALKAVPDNGTGYGVLRYMTDAGHTLQHQPCIRFNYLGNSNDTTLHRLVKKVEHPLGLTEDAGEHRPFTIDIIAYISAGVFHLYVAYSRLQYHEQTIASLLRAYEYHLVEIVRSHAPPIPLLANVSGQLTEDDIANFF